MRLGRSARQSSRPAAEACRTRAWRRLGPQALLLAAVALLPLHPPATGTMLLLPLDGSPPGATLAWALASGARPLGPGPYSGAWVVVGTRSALLGPALRHSTLLLAGGGAGCSFTAKDIDNA